MSSELTVFNFNEQTKIRITTDENGSPWWVATDVCTAMGHSNPSKAVADAVDLEDKAYLDPVRGGLIFSYTPGATLLVNESGLYSLILLSRKDEAKIFKRWITSEVLPSIRRTGTYSVPAASNNPLAQLKLLVASLEQQEADIAALKLADEQRRAEIQHVNERLDHAEYVTVRQYCKLQGISATHAVMQLWGRQAAKLSRARNVRIEKRTVDSAWGVENTYHTGILELVCVAKPSDDLEDQLKLI